MYKILLSLILFSSIIFQSLSQSTSCNVRQGSCSSDDSSFYLYQPQVTIVNGQLYQPHNQQSYPVRLNVKSENGLVEVKLVGQGVYKVNFLLSAENGKIMWTFQSYDQLMAPTSTSNEADIFLMNYFQGKIEIIVHKNMLELKKDDNNKIRFLKVSNPSSLGQSSIEIAQLAQEISTTPLPLIQSTVNFAIYEPGFVEIDVSAGKNIITYTVIASHKNDELIPIHIKSPLNVFDSVLDDIIKTSMSIKYDYVTQIITFEYGTSNNKRYKKLRANNIFRSAAVAHRYTYIEDSYIQDSMPQKIYRDGYTQTNVELYAARNRNDVTSILLRCGADFLYIIKHDPITYRVDNVYLVSPKSVKDQIYSSDAGIAYTQSKFIGLLNTVGQLSINPVDRTVKMSSGVKSNGLYSIEARFEKTQPLVDGSKLLYNLVKNDIDILPTAYTAELIGWQTDSMNIKLISSTHDITYTYTTKKNIASDEYTLSQNKKVVTPKTSGSVQYKEDQLKVQNIMDTATLLNILPSSSNQYKSLKFTSGTRSITYHANIPFNLNLGYSQDTVVATYHPWRGQTTTYIVVPETYFIDGEFESLYTAVHPAEGLKLTMYKIEEGHIKITVDLINKYIYDIYYQPQDGWVISKTVSMEILHPPTQGVDTVLQNKITKLCEDVQQLAFEDDGVIQILSHYGSRRLSYKAIKTVAGLSTSALLETYTIQSLSGLTDQIDSLACMIQEYTRMKVALQCNHHGSLTTYVINYAQDTKLITKKAVETLPQSTVLTDLASAIQQANYLKIYDSILQVVGPIYTVTITLKTSVVKFTDVYTIKNEPVTMLIAGGSQAIIVARKRLLQDIDVSDDGYIATNAINNNVLSSLIVSGDVSITTKIASPGRIRVDVAILGETWQWVIHYNEYTGAVHNVLKIKTEIVNSQIHKTLELVEEVVTKIRKVTITNHGMVLNTENGAMSLKKHTLGRYAVAPETYNVNNQPAVLYSGGEYPIQISLSQNHDGTAKMTLYGKKMYSFIYKFQHNDGWVLEKQYLGEQSISSNAAVSNIADMSAELRILDIMKEINQLSFEHDGQLQLISYSGPKRVVFKLSMKKAEEAVALPTYNLGTKYLKPETYMLNGAYKKLHEDTNYKYQVIVDQAYNGAVILTYRGIYEYKYFLEYQHQDGWVEYRIQISKSKSPIISSYTTSGMDAETKVIDIIKNCQQIAFETSGQLQFIKDYGSTRVSFQ